MNMKHSKLADIPEDELARMISEAKRKVRVRKRWCMGTNEWRAPAELDTLLDEMTLRQKRRELETSEINTKLSRDRLERAKADLSSRGQEELPNHHCINHE